MSVSVHINMLHPTCTRYLHLYFESLCFWFAKATHPLGLGFTSHTSFLTCSHYVRRNTNDCEAVVGRHDSILHVKFKSSYQDFDSVSGLSYRSFAVANTENQEFRLRSWHFYRWWLGKENDDSEI